MGENLDASDSTQFAFDRATDRVFELTKPDRGHREIARPQEMDGRNLYPNEFLTRDTRFEPAVSVWPYSFFRR